MFRKSWNKSDPEKRYINFTRDYRHFPKPKLSSFLFFILIPVPVILVILFYYPDITMALSSWTSKVISGSIGVQTTITSSEFIPMIGPVHFLDMVGSSPTFTFSLINLIVSVAILGILSFVESNMRSLIVYICMGAFVHAVSSAFFMFFPEYFPYALVDYSELYMEQQVAMWLIIALIAGLATALVYAPVYSKIITFFAILAYVAAYGITRYGLYLVILRSVSSLFMATLFFTLGVLFDFLQLVFIYTLFVMRASIRNSYGRGGSLWRWS